MTTPVQSQANDLRRVIGLAGGVALIVGITFLSGMQLFIMGVIGEYVGRIYQQVRERPRYLIQAILERRD